MDISQLSIKQRLELDKIIHTAKSITKNLTITDLPIDTVELIKKKGYNVTVQYETFERESGFVAKDIENNRYIIVVNKNAKNSQFVISHEVAHIILGHLNTYTEINERNCILEVYADALAYMIKIPSHLLEQLKHENIAILSAKFGVSAEIMRNRLLQIEKWTYKNCFYYETAKFQV